MTDANIAKLQADQAAAAAIPADEAALVADVTAASQALASAQAQATAEAQTITGLQAQLASVEAALAAAVAPKPPPPAPPALSPPLGVMLPDDRYIDTDRAAGVSIRVLEVEWGKWAPTAAGFDPTYKATLKAQVAGWLAKGYRVGIGSGLQYAPPWVTSLPAGQLVDQVGNRGKANIVFSPAVRAAAGAFITDLAATFQGQAEFVRIGTSENGECYLANPAAGAPNGESWWAFDTAAQTTPAAVTGACPMPGWAPGTPTWNGQPVTAAQAGAWWGWYQGAVINCLTWQIATIRAAGFRGKIHCPMPGIGLGVYLHNKRIANLLTPDPWDGPHAMATACCWYLIAPALAAVDRNLVLDSSSLGDSSTDNGSQPGDDTLPLGQADPWQSKWSGTRWLAYLARRNGLSIVGENSGNTPAAQIPQIVTCARNSGLDMLLWAWDYQLYDGTHATLSQVAAAAT